MNDPNVAFVVRLTPGRFGAEYVKDLDVLRNVSALKITLLHPNPPRGVSPCLSPRTATGRLELEPARE